MSVGESLKRGFVLDCMLLGIEDESLIGYLKNLMRWTK